MNYSVRELKIKNGENEIYGRLYSPETNEKSPAVILSHGYNGIGADFSIECAFYAENGFVAFAHDFCGGSTRSKSTGNSVDMTVFTEKSDLLAVFSAISELENVDKDKIFLFGGSMGGLVSALAAAHLKDKVKALALYYPALCVPDNWRETFPTADLIPDTVDFWGLKLGRNFFESILDLYVFDVIGTFCGDVLSVHGDKDAIVPIDYSQKLNSVYKNVEIVVLKDEGHGFSPEAGKIAMQKVLSFMQKHC